ncbi:MAG: DUF58 domain-containing protein [Planctomycetota bacterium]
MTGIAGEGLLDPAFMARLERIELIARRLQTGEARGDVTTRRRGPGSLFREHKNYSQGDDVRFVDWNVYSRLGELLVKQFDADENLDLTLYVDASGSMDFGQRRKLDFALRIAAIVGYIGLARQASVRLLFLPRRAGEDGGAIFFGKRRVQPFLTALDARREARGGTDFLREFRAAAGSRRGRGLAIVISDFFSETGYEKGLDFLLHAGYRVGAVQVLDVLDARPDLDGRLRLADLESPRTLERIVTRRMLDEYEAEVRRWCEGLARFCGRRGIAQVSLDTAWDFDRVLRSLLAGGGFAR